MKDQYKAPQVENLGGDGEQALEPVLTKEEKAATPPPPQPSLEEPAGIIGVGKMTNAKGTAVTTFIIARIDQHLKYLKGEQGFKDDEARVKEMTEFMETIANTLKLKFEQYTVVTDHLLSVIRSNPEIFVNGTAFRFTRNLGKDYPASAIDSYRNYMTLLSMVARAWQRRHKLNTLIDPTYTIRNLSTAGKENVTQYFNKLMVV